MGSLLLSCYTSSWRTFPMVGASFFRAALFNSIIIKKKYLLTCKRTVVGKALVLKQAIYFSLPLLFLGQANRNPLEAATSQ